MDKHSLSHTSWECVYHIVWIPKYRRKVLYGETRREVGEILRMLVDHMDGVEIVEGTACVDHIHICLRIAPKHSVSHVVGRLKGKSAIVLHERHPEWRKLTGRDRTLWARGYYVSTVGLNESIIRRYIQRQEDGSKIE
ncbi:MAG: IS200/IS605 family transposase [Atopobiaceae bacterium]|jgi:putative transposase|nr:IS200/IS605 family transposase [Atopobiaceae bacterium]